MRIRICPSLEARLDLLARTTNGNRSEAIRLAVIAAVERQGVQDNLPPYRTPQRGRPKAAQ